MMDKKVLGVLAAVTLSVGVAAPASAATAPGYDLLTMGHGTKTLGIAYVDNNYSGSRIEFRGESCNSDKEDIPDYQFPLPEKYRWTISSVQNMTADCQMGLRNRNGDRLLVGWEPQLGSWNDQTVTVQFS
ncbi:MULTISPECIES: hypothetical protein [unclassified Streptomyces]|uniref:hypothetical protein n=1 Tax=unclassified Streptomyces TaxID=2593676 RepID=UPI0003620DA8|nr:MULTISPECIES: hypothetical protein [unclassified Streptomyces]EYT79222.1 hypothetical protein CF54_32615 [Streptomyces sp. Tu 6176]